MLIMILCYWFTAEPTEHLAMTSNDKAALLNLGGIVVSLRLFSVAGYEVCEGEIFK